MAKLIYASNVSLDGCTEDERGAFDWGAPNDDVFAFITELMRSAGTYLYGRRMYATMAVWETDDALAAQSGLMSDFANVWQAAPNSTICCPKPLPQCVRRPSACWASGITTCRWLAASCSIVAKLPRCARVRARRWWRRSPLI